MQTKKRLSHDRLHEPADAFIGNEPKANQTNVTHDILTTHGESDTTFEGIHQHPKEYAGVDAHLHGTIALTGDHDMVRSNAKHANEECMVRKEGYLGGEGTDEAKNGKEGGEGGH